MALLLCRFPVSPEELADCLSCQDIAMEGVQIVLNGVGAGSPEAAIGVIETVGRAR